MSWLAVQVYTGQELRFLGQMIRDGLEGYSPTYRTAVRWSDRQKTVDRALFPGYVFAKIGQRERSRLVRIPQLVRILDTELPAAEMARLQALAVQPSVEPALFGGLIGQEVIFGPRHPLAGMQGRAVAASKGYSVRVEVEMLGRAVKVTCDGFDLIPVVCPAGARDRGSRGNRDLPGVAAVA
jgi:transcription antitermination factor NusG